MADFHRRLFPASFKGVPYDGMTDLYRAKYGLPLDGESHERFIATKVPYRKNKTIDQDIETHHLDFQ